MYREGRKNVQRYLKGEASSDVAVESGGKEPFPKSGSGKVDEFDDDKSVCFLTLSVTRPDDRISFRERGGPVSDASLATLFN